MRKKPEITFATVFRLAEIYQEQYLERGLCLSPEKNEACFRDFVMQYYSASYWRQPIHLYIDIDTPLF